MARTCWIGVAHRAQAMAARQGGFVAFSHGKEAAARKVIPGDGVIYYAPKTDFDGSPLRAFVALAEVTGDDVEQRDMPGTEFRPWVRTARYEAVTEVPVRPMLPDLGFIRNPTHWGMAFRRSLFSVPTSDFDRIALAMRTAEPSRK